MTGNGSRSFEVHCSLAVAETIRTLHAQARREGRARLLTAALRRIIHRLEFNPDRAGEPAYRLPALGLDVRTIVIQPLLVDYAINAEKRLVFIKGVKLLPKPRSG